MALDEEVQDYRSKHENKGDSPDSLLPGEQASPNDTYFGDLEYRNSPNSKTNSPILTGISPKDITQRISEKVKKSKIKFNEEQKICNDFKIQKKKTEPMFDRNSPYGRNSDEKGARKSDEVERISGSSNGRSSDSVGLEDFKILRFINKGSFGSVFLAYLAIQNKYFAIKCLQKEDLLRSSFDDKTQDLLEKVKLEQFIMQKVEHPFIVKMHYVYQKNYRIYFVMDYINGGELFKHI